MLGTAAVVLWCLAAVSSAADATLAYDRIKILLFTAGLIMMDIAGAVLMTLIWFLTKHYEKPNVEIRALDDYKYRAGYRDATARFLRLGPELHVVRPTIPIQQPRGCNNHANSGEQTSNHMS